MIKKIIKHMELNKYIIASFILNGQSYTGRMALVKSIYDNVKVIDGRYLKSHQKDIQKNSKLIIYNFEKIENIDYIDFNNTQIIAISNYESIPKSIQNKFAFIYEMPSLQTRTTEVQIFIERTIKQVQDILNVKIDEKMDIGKLDLSKNLKYIEAFIYKEIIKKTLSREDIEEALYIYLHSQIKNESGYKELLKVFERPLIKAGIDIHKSNLKLSQALGINRNTLSKKIKENA